MEVLVRDILWVVDELVLEHVIFVLNLVVNLLIEKAHGHIGIVLLLKVSDIDTLFREEDVRQLGVLMASSKESSDFLLVLSRHFSVSWPLNGLVID